MAGEKEKIAEDHYKSVYVGIDVCFKCRAKKLMGFYRRSIEKVTYCVRDALCRDCHADYKKSGFELKKVD